MIDTPIDTKPLHLESHNDWRLIPLVLNKPKLNDIHVKQINKIDYLIKQYYIMLLGRKYANQEYNTGDKIWKSQSH